MQYKIWARIDKGSSITIEDWEKIGAAFRQYASYEFGTETGDNFGVAMGIRESEEVPHFECQHIGENLMKILGKNADVCVSVGDDSFHFGVKRSTHINTLVEHPGKYD